MLNQCHIGDCRTLLREFAAAGVRVQTCVTSPPYYGLRDYGVDGQIGLEPTPDEYVAQMVEVFRCVRDVLADDGTLWLNLGDSYAATSKGSGGINSIRPSNAGSFYSANFDLKAAGLKPKDLIGIPWRVAFALQADGWYLRSDIIWHKPNPMPESVRDRPTTAHEYIFLLSKSPRYYYDWEAIKEPASPDTHARYARGRSDTHKWADGGPGGQTIARTFEHMRKPPGLQSGPGAPERRNKRSVWTVPKKGFSEAHFATFPPDLIKPCILAGSRPGDVVLDPFMGSGTTAQVAEHLGRQWIGCEINPSYLPLQVQRLAQRAMAF